MHTIQFQAWGHDAVVVCATCPTEGDRPTLLARAEPGEGMSLAAAVAAIEAHTGEAAFRAVVSSSAEYAVRNRHGYIREAEDLDHARFIRKTWAGRPKDEPSLDLIVRDVGEWRKIEESSPEG